MAYGKKYEENNLRILRAEKKKDRIEETCATNFRNATKNKRIESENRHGRLTRIGK